MASGCGGVDSDVGKGITCIMERTIEQTLAASGGVSSIIAMLETASSPDDLYQLLSLLRLALRGSMECLHQMDLLGGYAIVGRVLQRKSHMITRQTIRELLRITGLGQVPNLAIVANPQAAAHLVADFRLWMGVHGDVMCDAYSGLMVFLRHNVRRSLNAKQFHRVGLGALLQLQLCQPDISEEGISVVMSLLEEYLIQSPTREDLGMAAALALAASHDLASLSSSSSPPPSSSSSSTTNPVTNASTTSSRLDSSAGLEGEGGAVGGREGGGGGGGGGAKATGGGERDAQLNPTHPGLILRSLLSLFASVAGGMDAAHLDVMRTELHAGWFAAILAGSSNDALCLERVLSILSVLMPGNSDYQSKLRSQVWMPQHH